MQCYVRKTLTHFHPVTVYLVLLSRTKSGGGPAGDDKYWRYFLLSLQFLRHVLGAVNQNTAVIYSGGKIILYSGGVTTILPHLGLHLTIVPIYLLTVFMKSYNWPQCLISQLWHGVIVTSLLVSVIDGGHDVLWIFQTDAFLSSEIMDVCTEARTHTDHIHHKHCVHVTVVTTIAKT